MKCKIETSNVWNSGNFSLHKHLISSFESKWMEKISSELKERESFRSFSLFYCERVNKFHLEHNAMNHEANILLSSFGNSIDWERRISRPACCRMNFKCDWMIETCTKIKIEFWASQIIIFLEISSSKRTLSGICHIKRFFYFH